MHLHNILGFYLLHGVLFKDKIKELFLNTTNPIVQRGGSSVVFAIMFEKSEIFAESIPLITPWSISGTISETKGTSNTIKVNVSGRLCWQRFRFDSSIFDFWLIFQLQSPTQGEINYCIVFGHWGKWDESKQRADFENRGKIASRAERALSKKLSTF